MPANIQGFRDGAPALAHDGAPSTVTSASPVATCSSRSMTSGLAQREQAGQRRSTIQPPARVQQGARRLMATRGAARSSVARRSRRISPCRRAFRASQGDIRRCCRAGNARQTGWSCSKVVLSSWRHLRSIRRRMPCVGNAAHKGMSCTRVRRAISAHQPRAIPEKRTRRAGFVGPRRGSTDQYARCRKVE